MEREIGKVFRFEGKWLKVQEGESLGSCEHCYFEKEDCARFRSFIGVCTHKERSDKKGVIFEDITYIPEENLKAEQPQKQEQQEIEEPKEREIGETFEYKGRKLKAIEKEGIDDCDGCVLFKEDCKRVHDLVGECEGKKRNDGKGVVFVDVDEFDDYPLIEKGLQEETEEIKERKIGDTFEYQGIKLKVMKQVDGCTGCYFKGSSCRNNRIIGECIYCRRSDKIGVIFVEVKEEQPQDEQPQELNLCEVLKYCPEGETFWSPMLGDVKLNDIDQETKKINVILASGATWDINADGTISIDNVTSPEVMLYPSSEQMAWTKVKYEPKHVLPRSWEEFCVTHDITMSEYFIGETGNIFNSNSGPRIPEISKTILPSEQAAEAHLAYMQLHQLRNAWREGWLPNWRDDSRCKYVIINIEGDWIVTKHYTASCFLSFQDEKRADEFLDCFIDLIRKAGDLI